MDDIQRRAICSCGALSVAVRGDPAVVGMCHCLACQRRTGSAFGLAAFFARDQVEAIDGARSAWSREAESGATLTFNFCPSCGSNVFWERSGRPDMIAIAVGAFADPDFPGPKRMVWTQSRHHWLDTLYELAGHPTSPA